MTQSIEQRFSYHPDPRSLAGSDRKVSARLDLIRSEVDFKNKTVLDLGCSGGFFSFSLAAEAKNIIAIDGDPDIIARNKALQKELSVGNIDFVHAAITPDIISSIGEVDVILFLSVYHHMLTSSAAYGWNQGSDTRSTDRLLDAINLKTKILIFEIGYPNEGYEWCERLPDYGNDWDKFVVENVFRHAYRSVDVKRPVITPGIINDYVIQRLSVPYKEDSIFVQRLKGLFKFDSRDYRKLYFGKK